MTPPINIDGTQITGASIDGSEVSAITVDGTQVFSAIPDAAVRQWPFTKRTNSTVVENVADDDGTVSGGPTNTADSSFYDGYYEALDGTNDAILLPVGELENQIQSKDWGLAFTVRAGSDFLDGSAALCGVADSGFDDALLINDASSVGTADDGQPEFRLRQGGGGSGIETNTPIDDGTIYRVFWRVNTDDPSNWAIYLNDSDASGTTVNRGIDGSQMDFAPDAKDISIGSRNASGILERFVSADVDHPILYSSPDRQTVTDDYQLQPFA